jgi:hypothetical protein
MSFLLFFSGQKRVSLISIALLAVLLASGALSSSVASASTSSSSSCSAIALNTLAGKLACLYATPGLHISFSGFVQQEADMVDQPNTGPTSPISPTYVLSSPLDGTSILAPDVTVNQDTAAATQNEPAIAVDPSNPDHIVAAANDYVTRTWSCTVGSTPCSTVGDGYSGTYFSNDGGKTWCCAATDPSHIGTLIPGVEHLVRGEYDAGGDPALAFDSHGNVYYSGLGFDRTSPSSTVAVNKGTFDSSGTLTWGAPTFINPTTLPAILNDKPWIGVDSHTSSPFRDRVYVSWTRFIFDSHTGRYVQSPIDLVYSTDGGKTFSTPQLIVGNVIYDQGSHIVVGPDGTVYVFWEGSTQLATYTSIWMSKSTDGGVTFSKPVAVAPLIDISTPKDTVFRVNSFPMADIASDGALYVAWSAEITNGAPASDLEGMCFGDSSGSCYAAAVWSKSTDGGATWSSPAFVFAQGARTAKGYPVTQPDGSTLNAPIPIPMIDSFFPSVAAASNGNVYISAYVIDFESPWQTCAKPASPAAVGRIDCLMLGPYINNGRLDYAVADLTTGVTKIVTTHPINSRYQFGGDFIGDYAGIAVGSDNTFHAVWTDTNNVQTVVWWYGFEFTTAPIHQQDIATDSDSF